MNEPDPTAELITAGLQEYWLVKSAVGAFENIVEKLAKAVWLSHLDDLRAVIPLPDLKEHDIVPGLPWALRGQVAVGVSAKVPGTWGIRLGIRWPKTDVQGSLPVACLSVAVSAASKKDKLFRALIGAKPTDVRVEATAESPHEVYVTTALEPDASGETISQALNTVITGFAALLRTAGDLQGLVT